MVKKNGLLKANYILSTYFSNQRSSVIESPCTAVVGASGGIYGLIGMFIMEMVLNWKRLKR